MTTATEKINITESDSRYTGTAKTYVTYLKLADGKEIKFMLLQSPPKIGVQVPILVDIYDDGSRYYHYNQLDWQLLH